MIDILDELTEIPFDVFWNKYQEISKGEYNKLKAKAIWFAMLEEKRVEAFRDLSKCDKMTKWIVLNLEPFEYLNIFNK